MVSMEKFQYIKQKYGHYASWAVWAEEGVKPKDNIGDLTIFDTENNRSLLQQLNPNLVFVGLNISRRIQVPLGNFHDSRPQGMDFKIRYAFKGTPYWGGYMTDIIKDFEQKLAGKVTSYLRKNRAFERENVKTFQAELTDLEADNLTIIAFGNDAHSILKRNLGDKYPLVKIPHYSMYISKERYKERVISILGQI
jgi:hypothetical protein